MFYHLQKIFFITTFVATSSYNSIKVICEEKDFKTNKVSGESVLDNVRAGLEEVLLFKDGKLKTTPAKDFLNEL